MKTYTNVDEKKKGEKTTPEPGKGKIDQKRLKEGREKARTTRQETIKNLSESYDGAAAPMVGGKVDKGNPTPQGAPTVKLIKKSIKKAKQSAASPQAKKAAIRALRGRY